MTSQEVQCWVWGSDPDYFATRGCRTPIPLRPTISSENPGPIDMDDSPKSNPQLAAGVSSTSTNIDNAETKPSSHRIPLP